MRTCSTLMTFAAAVVAAAWLAACRRLGARQAAPGAPANLTYVVSNGGNLQLQWTHSTGTFTHYMIEAGPGPGAPPFLRLPDVAVRQSGRPNSQAAAAAAARSAPAGIGGGNYYVRIRGVNGAVGGAASATKSPLPITRRLPGARRADQLHA